MTTGNNVWKNIFINVDELQLPAPLAYYPFNGNADDETGNGYDGEVNGATLTLDRFGKADSAYAFNGMMKTGDYISIENLFYGSSANALQVQLIR